jgi:dTDP-4-amino-4,6-dideoxygalactose transaminase
MPTADPTRTQNSYSLDHKVLSSVNMIKVSQALLGKEELLLVSKAFDYGYFGQTPTVTQFEENLAQYLGAQNVVATNSGTAALHLSLAALEIGAGDEVIVPSLTFVACFQAISAVGATPVPCDVDPNTLCMDINDAQKKITPKTKTIMAVHYSGTPTNLDFFYSLKARGIRVIEDAAHAFGATLQGKKIGSFGDITCFSFDSIKNITCGEGGAVTTNDKEIADRIRVMRLLGINRPEGLNQGQRWKYEVKMQGYRYHMSSINASIGLAQLKKIDSFLDRRKEICQMYDVAFSKISALKCLTTNYSNSAPHIYVIRVKNQKRDALMQYLDKQDIETSIHYIPNHLHPLYRDDKIHLPNTEKAFEEILTLPLHCNLSNENVNHVIKSIQRFFQEEI